MPLYKKSAAERAAEKEGRERILSFVQKMGTEGIEDLQDVYKMMIGAVLEGSLEPLLIPLLSHKQAHHFHLF